MEPTSRKYLFFDLDGTLTDSMPGIAHAVQYALRRFGIDVQDLAALKPFLGPPLRDSFMEFYGMSPEEADRAVAVSREYFVPRGMFENELYPGIPELLAATAAAGRVNVIATSKPQPFAERIAAHFGVIRHALSARGIAPDEAVMIGDRRHDVEGAAEEGLPAIAVEWGYAPPGELEAARPLRIVPDVETLRRLLLGNE